MTIYEIAHIIASGVIHLKDGDYIKNCIITSVNTISPKEASKYYSLHLSRNTTVSRIQDIFSDVECQLMNIIKDDLLYYSLALDESKDVSDSEQLCVYIRGVTKNET